MNICLHERAERIIYQSMRLNPAQPGKLFGNDVNPEMPKTAFGALVTCVQVAFVFNLERAWAKCIRQARAYFCDSFGIQDA